MREILGKAKTIRELLSGAKYSIDYYQREYRWQNKQVSELIDDLTGRFQADYDEGQAREEVERLAIQYYEEGKLQESYDLLASLAKENNGDAVVFLYLGRIAFQGGKNEAAEKCFRKAIEANPKFAPPHSDLSAMLLSQKRYAEAEKSAATAVRLDPKYTLGFANLGINLPVVETVNVIYTLQPKNLLI